MDIGASHEQGLDVGAYVAPEIETYSPQEFLNVLGPAQGYGGGSESGSRMYGRTVRSLPGLRD